VATVAFAEQGVAGTSLDTLAGQLGVTKQTILYHFGSKNGLIEAVLSRAADDLVTELRSATADSEPGWASVEAAVRASFALALRRPELVGVLRETSRLGPPWSRAAVDRLEPIVAEAENGLRRGMRNGAFGPHDPRLLLASAYAVVSGVVTEPEVLRIMGLTLDVRVAAGLRRTLLSFLEAVLVPGTPGPPATYHPERQARHHD
jgi:AcrR family transcriptional regulator